MLFGAAKSPKAKRKKPPKNVLKLPDLEQSKSAVLNSLTSASSQRSYDHAIREFIEWYCSAPRLAFNKIVVTCYRISLEQALRCLDHRSAFGGGTSSCLRSCGLRAVEP